MGIKRKKIGGDQDGVSVESAADFEPQGKLVGEKLAMLGTVEEPFIEAEWLQVNDLKVESVTEIFHLTCAFQEIGSLKTTW